MAGRGPHLALRLRVVHELPAELLAAVDDALRESFASVEVVQVLAAPEAAKDALDLRRAVCADGRRLQLRALRAGCASQLPSMPAAEYPLADAHSPPVWVPHAAGESAAVRRMRRLVSWRLHSLQVPDPSPRAHAPKASLDSARRRDLDLRALLGDAARRGPRPERRELVGPTLPHLRSAGLGRLIAADTQRTERHRRVL